MVTQPQGQHPLLTQIGQNPHPHSFIWGWPEDGGEEGHGNLGQALTMEL